MAEPALVPLTDPSIDRVILEMCRDVVGIYKIDQRAQTASGGVAEPTPVPVEGLDAEPCFLYILDPTTRVAAADNARMTFPNAYRITFARMLPITSRHRLRWADPVSGRVRWLSVTGNARAFGEGPACVVGAIEQTS